MNEENLFCKIFEVEGYQLLVMLSYDEDNESEALEIKTTINDLTAAYNISGFPNEDSKKALANFDQVKAKEVFQTLKELLI